MFKTKKVLELEAEISKLRSELSAEQEKTRRSAFIETAALPKCKSLACADCKYVVVQRSPYGGSFILDCGKNNPCDDYKKDELSAREAAAIQSALQSQVRL